MKLTLRRSPSALQLARCLVRTLEQGDAVRVEGDAKIGDLRIEGLDCDIVVTGVHVREVGEEVAIDLEADGRVALSGMSLSGGYVRTGPTPMQRAEERARSDERKWIALMLRGVADTLEPPSTETAAEAFRSAARMVEAQEHHEPELASLYESLGRKRAAGGDE